MNLTATHLTAGVRQATSAGDSVSSVNTESVSPGSNKLILLFVMAREAGGSNQSNIPSISGNGLTWVHVGSVGSSSNTLRASVFRAMGESPSSGAITISFGGQDQSDIAWAIDEFDGVITTGTNGEDAVIQIKGNTSTDDLTITFDTTPDAGNAVWGAAHIRQNSSFTWEDITIGSGFTKLGGATFGGTPHFSQRWHSVSQWINSNDDSVFFGGGDSGDQRGFAVEIAVAEDAAGRGRRLIPSLIG